MLTVTGLGLGFPHVLQAARILCYPIDEASGRCTHETVYAINDLSSTEASPQRIAHLARSQWTIENRLHHVRDTAFGERSSKIGTGHGPTNMATLRNLAINTCVPTATATSPPPPRGLLRALHPSSQAPGHQLTCTEA